MSSRVDWFSVFRAVEAIERYFGSEKAMRRSKIVDGEELKRVKRMANSFRHLADGIHTPPIPAIDLNVATRVVARSIDQIARSLGV